MIRRQSISAGSISEVDDDGEGPRGVRTKVFVQRCGAPESFAVRLTPAASDYVSDPFFISRDLGDTYLRSKPGDIRFLFIRKSPSHLFPIVCNVISV